MKSIIYYSLYDRLLHRGALAQAFAKVRRARGAPGIDGQSIADFASHQDEELDHLLQAPRTKSYRPLPVKRVMIPKNGRGRAGSGNPHSARPDRPTSDAGSTPAHLRYRFSPVKLRLSAGKKLPGCGCESDAVHAPAQTEICGGYGLVQVFRSAGS
jgi:hypothetical protein